MMLDPALLSVVGGGPQLWRNTIVAVVKLVLLVVFALVLSEGGSLSIYASWFLANVVSVVTMTIWLARTRQVTLRRMRPTRSALRGLHHVAAQHHALNLALLVPIFRCRLSPTSHSAPNRPATSMPPGRSPASCSCCRSVSRRRCSPRVRGTSARSSSNCAPPCAIRWRPASRQTSCCSHWVAWCCVSSATRTPTTATPR